MGQRLFISDLHLSPEHPLLCAAFICFLHGRARAATDLYILGDLFDAWIGDDDDRPDHLAVIAALRALVATGTQCWLMHGNRDFLLGQRFARASGCRLLRDPSLVRIRDETVLLMHGDLLCSDDRAYQRFRRRVRNPLIKRLFLWQSLHRRRRAAADYRARSRAAMAEKPPASMDVSPETVAAYLRRHAAQRLIHGHTHKPADHQLCIAGRVRTRQVLSDWRVIDGTAQAEVLVEENGRWWREAVHTSALNPDTPAPLCSGANATMPA